MAAKKQTKSASGAGKATRKTAKKTVRKAAAAKTERKTTTAAKKRPQAKRKATTSKASTNGTAFKKDGINMTNGQKQTVKAMEQMMTQGKTQFDKLANDATSASKEQFDAMVQSGNIFMKGCEDIMKTYMSWAQTSTEKNTKAVKTLLSCKTLNEFTETQNKLAHQNFDDFMAGATKVSELGVKVATDAFAPINEQMSRSIKKASETMAA